MQIEELIKKYFNGETSLQEEARLRDYFSREDVPKHLHPYKEHFQFLIESKKEHITNAGFDEKVLQEIEKKREHTLQPKRKFFYIITGIAASIIVVVGLFFISSRKPDIDYSGRISPENTYKDPKLAYAETKKTLLFVSGCLNTGLDEFNKISKFDEYKQMILNY